MSIKHFPADTSLEYKTFLNDPKMDGELYNYLLSMSYGEKETGLTVVYKNNLPSQEKIGEILRQSRRTVINHLNYLKEQEYLIDDAENKRYILPRVEKMFFKVPQETIVFLRDTVKDPVVKTYIYLGQRNSFKPGQYIFTVKEICEHLGLSYDRHYKVIKNYLVALAKFGLISYTTFYNDNVVPQMRLLSVSTKCPVYEEKCKNVILDEGKNVVSEECKNVI